MNVGQVSKRVDIKNSKIWYYIELGLIVPIKNNGRYDFKEQDIEELILIKKLKSCKFSLEEIHKIISLYRCSYLAQDRDLNEFKYFLGKKKEQIDNEIISLKESLKDIEEIIEKAEEKTQSLMEPSGIDIGFLHLFVCPHCNKPLRICDSYIQNNQIYKGHLECDCGFYASIIDGAIICNLKDEYEKNETISYTLLTQFDAKTLTSTQKIVNILNYELSKADLKGKVIIETNIGSFFYLLNNIDKLDDNAQYIIADASLEMIKYYKNQFDRMNINKKILFIVSEDYKLPIKKGCIDIWIDYFDSTMYAGKEKTLLHNVLLPYLKNGSKVIGCLSISPHNAPYLNTFKDIYKEGNMEDFIDNNFFIQLKHLGFEIKRNEHIDYFYATNIKVRNRISSIKDLVNYYEAIYNKNT